VLMYFVLEKLIMLVVKFNRFKAFSNPFFSLFEFE